MKKQRLPIHMQNQLKILAREVHRIGICMADEDGMVVQTGPVTSNHKHRHLLIHASMNLINVVELILKDNEFK